MNKPIRKLYSTDWAYCFARNQYLAWQREQRLKNAAELLREKIERIRPRDLMEMEDLHFAAVQANLISDQQDTVDRMIIEQITMCSGRRGENNAKR